MEDLCNDGGFIVSFLFNKKKEDRGTSLYGAERGNEWAAKSNRAEGLILVSRRRKCPRCLENSTPEGGKMQLQKRC